MEKLKQVEPAPSVAADIKGALQVEINRRNWVRAVMLAQQYQCPQEETHHLQELALKQMACEYRNASPCARWRRNGDSQEQSWRIS